MRVPNLSLYSSSNYQLNNLTNNLNDANEVMATQKQINAIGDDPVGLSQVLDLNASIASLEQYYTNVNMGISWLSSAEPAIKTIRDQVGAAHTLANQMANAAASATERKNAVETVDGIINQILAMANTQVNGSYIFGGTRTNTAPFAYDDEVNPRAVVYSGNATAFSIQGNATSTTDVGQDGGALLTVDRIVVNSTNNKVIFREDPGKGENSKIVVEGTIPDGAYTPEELAVVVRNAMNSASEKEGHGLTYEVDYDAGKRTFTIQNDGAYDGYMKVDMLWESGEVGMVSEVKTENILREGIYVEVKDANALDHNTPEPDGTAPIRLTWDEEDSVWNVLNDPGYDLPLKVDGTDSHVELDLTGNGVSDIVITMADPAADGGYIEFDINTASEERSIGPDMGFDPSDVSHVPPTSSSPVVLRTFDSTNSVIDFQENTGAGLTPVSAVIPKGDYTSMDELAAAIETAMESASFYDIDYKVSYDDTTNRFAIESNSGALTALNMLWATGPNNTGSAGAQLGFTADTAGIAAPHVSDTRTPLFTVNAGVNDAINFKEILPGSSQDSTVELTGTIAAGPYYDAESLARAVEDAMEDASAQYGNRVDYDVSYSYNNRTFSIEEDGTLGRKLEDLALLWDTGADVTTSAAGLLGFDEKDVTATVMEGEPETWGVFETLFDFKKYLAANDVNGIQRTMARLENHYKNLTSEISDIGMKYNQLTTIQKVGSETTSSLKERRSGIEDVDFARAVMDLSAVETAYNASLSSTAKIINVSLVDYM